MPNAPVKEMVSAVQEIGLRLALTAAVALLLGVLVHLLGRRLPARVARWLWGALVLGALGLCLYTAWQQAWLADDAFISFRYARNLVEGHGLVFNPGEWVEGYTNFLWTALLAGAGALGGNIPAAALVGNVAACLATVASAAVIVRRFSPTPGIIPWAALGLAASVSFTEFATSGLETMPAALLVVLGLWAALARRTLLSGTLLVLAALTRPDHLLFWGAMGLAMATEDVWLNAGRLLARLQWRRYAMFALPVLFLWVPYFLINWHVYGEPFPNTYYAKSGGLSYWSQGVTYAAVTLVMGGAWLWLSAFVILSIARARSREELLLRLFALFAIVTHGLYVIRVGGDFMANRFFIAYWPIILIALEVGLRWRLSSGRWPSRVVLAPVGALAFAGAVTPVALIKPFEKKWHVAVESSFYRLANTFPPEVESRYTKQGKRLQAIAEAAGVRPRVAIDCVGQIGWYTDLELVDLFGLTNHRIGHKPLADGKRGRPGHEKSGDLDDVLAEGALLSVQNHYGRAYESYVRIDAGGGLTLHFVRESPELYEALKGVEGVRLPPRLDALIAEATKKTSRAAALADWRFLSRFADPAAHGEALRALEARLGLVADFEFGMPPAATTTGDAVTISKQPLPRGASGEGWLELDGPGRRRITLPVDLSEAQELQFALGGDASPGHRVELWADGVVQRSASPGGTRDLKPVAWDVSGMGAAELVIVDEVSEPDKTLRVDGFFTSRALDIIAELERPTSGVRRLELIAEAEETLPETHPARLALSRMTTRWTFEDGRWPAGTEVTGTAFGGGPVSGPLEHQGGITAIQGKRFANSYHGGDGATGRIVFPPVRLTSDGITLRVAGLENCAEAYVALESNGELVSPKACGRRDEQLRPVTLKSPKHVGELVNLVVVDESTGRWGHILVDDVLFEAGPVSQPDVPFRGGGIPSHLGPKLPSGDSQPGRQGAAGASQ